MEKKHFQMAILIFTVLIMVAIPALMINIRSTGTPKESTSVLLYRQAENSVSEIDFSDYIVGCVAANLDFESSYPKEALLAITLATESKLLSICRRSPCCDVHHADYCDHPDHVNAYVDKDELIQTVDRQKVETLLSEITSAVDRVYGFGICYNGEIALTLSHESSYLLTESASAVCDTDIPYLRSVRTYEEIQPFDILLADDVISALLKAEFGVENAVPEIENRTASGRVEQVRLGSICVSGIRFADALLLPSTDFTMETAPGGIRFTIRGIGNGIGLSRKGAVTLAQNGYDLDQIISAYYPGTSIQPIEISELLQIGRSMFS